MPSQQPARPNGPRPVRPVPAPEASHLIRLPNQTDHRLFRGWGITL